MIPEPHLNDGAWDCPVCGYPLHVRAGGDTGPIRVLDCDDCGYHYEDG